ncbi:Formate dehydrogenase, mitochondrial [Capsicum annuum]|nr:Formate dehydrogenase, mitochondrial [Capsicum annuum]
MGDDDQRTFYGNQIKIVFFHVTILRTMFPSYKLEKHIPNLHVLISTPSHLTYVTAERIKKAKNLQLLLTAGIGSNHVNLKTTATSGLTIVEVTGSNTISVVKDELMRILILIQNFFPGRHHVINGDWNVARITHISYDLKGKTIGIVIQDWLVLLRTFDQYEYYDINCSCSYCDGGSNGSSSGELITEENFLEICSREVLTRGGELLKRTHKVVKHHHFGAWRIAEGAYLEIVKFQKHSAIVAHRAKVLGPNQWDNAMALRRGDLKNPIRQFPVSHRDCGTSRKTIMPPHRTIDQNAQTDKVHPTHGMRTQNRAQTPEINATPGVPPTQTSLLRVPRAPQTGTNLTQPSEREATRVGQFMRMNPPKFTGIEVEEDPLEFMDEMEKIFKVMHVDEVERVKLAAYQLKDVEN